MLRVRALHLYDLQNGEASCINLSDCFGMLAGTASRRGVELGRIRIVDGQREADAGEELPENGTDRHGTRAPWTRRVQTAG